MSLRVVIMGVSGTGKTSLGTGLSQMLGIPYLDGDDLHPEANVAKMAAGIPLTDEDRWPWLDLVAQTLNARAPVIVGCSALRRAYRDRLRAGAGGRVHFLHLTGPREVIAARMQARQGHYMPPALLDSQFATLEPPGRDEAVPLDITLPLADLVAIAAAELHGPDA
ncbi:gluconokinase [Paracoccus sp. (in: a-proteobacteria)]|uniref:gluconokinase n=1 Tax=Paracoccus sp. TaxID=267 RepID=UPI002729DC39|nr:gluconokinase [Paracoccus sp. (in: a-proteobacteria)]